MPMKLLRLLPVLLALSGSAWGQRVDNPPGVPVGGPVSTNTVTIPGGPTNTLLQISPSTFNATGYGNCVWDQGSSHDIAPCITAAIAAAAAAGGGHVIIPSGTYAIYSEIINNVNGVDVHGQGHNNGQNPTTSLVWHGGVGGTMAQLGVSFSGAAISGSGFTGIYFDCNEPNAGGNGQARRGIYAVNASYSTIDAFVEEPYVASPTTGGLNAVAFDIDANVNFSKINAGWSMVDQTLPAGAAIAPVNTYTVNQLPYPSGFFIHSNPANGLPDTSNTDIDIHGTQAVGVPVQVDWSDHNHFKNVYLFLGTPGASLLGAVVFNNANTSLGASAATGGNTVDNYGAAAPIIIEGSGTNISAPVGITITQNYSNGGTPPPVYDSGSAGSWMDDYGTSNRTSQAVAGISNHGAYARTLVANCPVGVPMCVGQDGGTQIADFYTQDGIGVGYFDLTMNKIGTGNYDLVFNNVGISGGVEVPVLKTPTIYALSGPVGVYSAVNFFSTITAGSLATSGTIAGSICSTSPGVILYEAGVNCYAPTGVVSASALSFTGSAPVVSACGTSPSIDGHATNNTGTVTVGTVAAASCTVTFANSGFTTWNHCRVTPQTALATFGYSYTKTVLTVTATSLLTEVFDYQCDGS